MVPRQLFLLSFLILIIKSNPLNIHIIAHTHDDVGWLKTVDQYYMGSKERIQNAGVQYIFDTVIHALQDNPERKFIYVETAFFYRWWNEQGQSKKDQLKKLVDNGQWEFINGGWSMNDEACTHYQVITDNMAMGARFIQSELGVLPRVGWHIDPFGHQQTQASLMYQFGFDGFFFARIDFEDYAQRKSTQRLQTIWRPSQSLGPATQVFTGAFWDGTYCYPSGYSFEGGEDPIQDNPDIFDMNVKEKADTFVDLMNQRAPYFMTKDILVTYGCDFQYMNAQINFKNMDKLIKYINANKEYNMTLFYSTPTQYLDAVNKANVKWPVKTDDFLPYADNGNSYWTGFYTSRPALKGYARSRVSLIHSVESLITTAMSPNDVTPVMKSQLVDLRNSLNIANHHDAITGTEKQAVNDDYAKRLSIGTSAVYETLSSSFGSIIGNGRGSPKFTFCPMQNETLCPATDPLNSITNDEVLPVVISNPLEWPVYRTARIPVPISGLKVFNSTGGIIPAEVHLEESKYVLYFPVSLAPLGYEVYFISLGDSPLYKPVKSSSGSIASDHIQLDFSDNSVSNYVDLKSKSSNSLHHDFMWYKPVTSGQASGAYIFRPQGQAQGFSYAPQLEFTNGSLVQTATITQGTWLKKRFILERGMPVLVEQHVGTISISDGHGKEIISRYTTNIDNQKVFYTDSQGQEMIKRTLNHRPSYNLTLTEPISGNYYPLSQSIFIQDNSARFTVISDRARGGSSLTSGQVETMVHRRLLVDDGRGVGEPLDDQTKIITSDYIMRSKVDVADQDMRTQMQYSLNPIQYTYGTLTTMNNWKDFRLQYSGLKKELPKNVYLQTLRPILYPQSSKEYILRLHHIYAVNEDPILSLPVTVNVNDLFQYRSIVSMKEMNLAATIEISEIKHLSWSTESDVDVNAETSNTRTPFTLEDGNVILGPMETRTFIISLK